MGVGGEHSPIFVSGDKNQFTIKREMALRAARRVVETAYPGTKFFNDKVKEYLSLNMLTTSGKS